MKSGCGIDEVFQSGLKWYERLEFLKNGEIVLYSNVDTIALDAPTPKHHKLILSNSLKKRDCLRQKYGNFKLKTGRAYRSR